MAYSDADLKEERQLFADDTAEWAPIRAEADIDMRYAAGDPWDPSARQAREKVNRLCPSDDELGQYTNQVVNEVRANKRAVKFTPIGNGANDDSAKFYEDKMREIEYRSRAQIAYTTAFENAVQRSFGFGRVSTRYESSRSVNQDIWIDPIHNPNLITPDPYALMPDLSDQKRCWVREPWRLEDFNTRWAKYKIKAGSRAHGDLMRDASTWVSANQVWVSEHWKITTTKRKLLIVQPAAPQQAGSMLNLRESYAEPIAIFEDEIEKGQPVPGEVIGTRDVDDPKVSQCLTNGVEILEEVQHPGKYIPIFGCLGKVIYLDEGQGARRKILSMIRLARDPFTRYCYYTACELELIGMTPKFPYFARRGSLKPDQLLALQKSLHEPVAVIEVENQIPGSPAPPEFPMRQPYEPPIQALEVGKESARRAIQAAMGQSPLPTQAQRRNEKSGIALKQIEESGQRGSFHFTDHYLDMITQVGVIVEDLMDKIYDTARKVGVRHANDTAEIVTINDPAKPQTSTKGDHLVTVSTGPTFESERDAASDFADTLAQISPEIFALLGPLIVKLKNLGPIGDEMIELLETIQPPPVQALRQQKEGAEQDPRAMMQQLQQAKTQLQQVEQVAQQMKQALDTDAAKTRAQGEIKRMELDAQHELQITLQTMKDAAAIRIAEINAAVKGYQLEAAHADAHEAQALDQVHDAHEAELDRQHTAGMAAMGHANALEQGDQAHQNALEQGEQGVAGQMATQQQAADLAPEPAEGASA